MSAGTAGGDHDEGLLVLVPPLKGQGRIAEGDPGWGHLP